MRQIITNNLATKDGRKTRIGAACRLGNVLVLLDRPADRGGGMERAPVWLTLSQAKRLERQIMMATTQLATTTRKAPRRG